MRKLFALLLAVLLLTVTVSAATPCMVDDAKLMTITAANDLESKFSSYDSEYGFTVAALTTNSFGDKYAADFAKAAYLQAQYSNDGVLLVISEQEGQWYLYTSGICAEAISDETAAKVGADLKEALETGDYYGALQSYAEACSEPVIAAIEVRTESARETQKWNKIFVLLGMMGGLVVGIMVVLTLSPKKKSEEEAEKKAERKAKRMAKEKPVEEEPAEETPVAEAENEADQEQPEAKAEPEVQEANQVPEAQEVPQEQQTEEDPFEQELQEMWDLLKDHVDQEEQTTV